MEKKKVREFFMRWKTKEKPPLNVQNPDLLKVVQEGKNDTCFICGYPIKYVDNLSEFFTIKTDQISCLIQVDNKSRFCIRLNNEQLKLQLCDNCDGDGLIDDKICQKCDGQGFMYGNI